MTWYVAHTTTGDERRVAERMRERGIEPWHHPLLPGYVLARGSPSAIRYTEDVLRVLPFSDRPQAIPDDAVAILDATCRAYDNRQAERKPDAPPIAGMARRMVADLFAKAGFSVTMASERVELTTSSPVTGRQHSAHQRRRAVRAVAGA